MSEITQFAHDDGIDNPAEVGMLEQFFENGEIRTLLDEAEKNRIRRFMVLIPSIILVCAGLIYFGSLGIVQVEIGDSGRYRPSNSFDGIYWGIIAGFIVFGIIVRFFYSKIEGFIKEKILKKLSKEIYSKLEYDPSTKYAFGDLGVLRSKGFLSSYDSIDKLEDSIGMTIEENRKFLIAQGYELQTSEVRGSGKNRRRVVTNHCYLMKVRFPLARIPLENTLYIHTDENDTILNGSIRYALLGGFIGFFLSMFLSTAIESGFIIPLFIIIGAMVGYFLRKRYRDSKRVVLENLDFEKLYDVVCEDQIGSRMILTPAFMDRLVRLAQKSKHKFEFIYEADCFYIKWNLHGAYLEVNTWKKITKNMATYVHWYSQMKEILSFIFDMRLLYFSKTNTEVEVNPELTRFETMSEAVGRGFGNGNMLSGMLSLGGVLSLFTRK